jgi:hyperosmotically inducible periplasmic protein
MPWGKLEPDAIHSMDLTKEPEEKTMNTHTRWIAYLLGITLILMLAACGGTETRRSTGTYVDDKVISAQVKAELARDAVTKATQIQVETYEGVVQLSGFADTQEAVTRAAEIARDVDGVQRVVNDIRLR